MKWWNLLFRIISAIGSVATAGTFIYLSVDRYNERKKLKNIQNSALKVLKSCLKKVEETLRKVKDRERFSEIQIHSVSNTKSLLREIMDKLTIVLGIKVIDDDIHSALFISRNKVLEISNLINNNSLTECQSKKLEKILSELGEEIYIEINRLE